MISSTFAIPAQPAGGHTIATAGHVDHGKSALVLALTGCDPDRLPEEKRRGLTIELGFTELALPSGRTAGLIDVPGHESLVKTMIAGVQAIDLVLLVVAGDEGISAQTREHFDVCRLLGLEKGIVVVTKADLIDDRRAAALAAELDEFLRGSFLEKAPHLRVSALKKTGLEALKTTIDQELPTHRKRAPFRLWVDRSFTRAGFGSIVAGTALGDGLAVGDEVEMIHGEARQLARLRGIECHGRAQPAAEPGMRTALNLTGIAADSSYRGWLLALPGRIRCGRRLWAELRFDANTCPPEKRQFSASFLIGTAQAEARVKMVNDRIALVRLDRALPIVRGERFLLRTGAPSNLAGGRVLTAAASTVCPAPETLTALGEANDTATAVLPAIFAVHAPFGLTMHELLGFLRPEAQDPELVQSRLVPPEFRALDPVFWLEKRFQELVLAAHQLLADFAKKNPLRPGMPKAELVSRLGKGEPPEAAKRLESFLDELVREGKLRIEADLIGPVDRVPGDLPPAIAGLAEKLRRELDRSGLQAPTVPALATALGQPERTVREVLSALVRRREIVKINDEYFCPAPALEILQDKLISHLRRYGKIDVPGFKTLSATTRKHSIPLLEYFDREKITLRVGEGRTLRAQTA
jgi:selenocysteine-specific elongation factor